MKAVRPITEACPAPGAGPIAAGEAERLAGALRVLADPARLRLLSLISEQADAGACGCELSDPLGLTQPTVSHHLKVLHDAGLVTRERDGVWVCYRVDPAGLRAVARALEGLASAPAAGRAERPGRARSPGGRVGS